MIARKFFEWGDVVAEVYCIYTKTNRTCVWEDIESGSIKTVEKGEEIDYIYEIEFRILLGQYIMKEDIDSSSRDPEYTITSPEMIQSIISNQIDGGYDEIELNISEGSCVSEEELVASQI